MKRTQILFIGQSTHHSLGVIGLILALSILLPTLWSCNRIDTVINEIKTTRDQTLFSIDKAITGIQNAPSDWENVLFNLKDALVKDLQETIREDVQQLITRSTGAAGTQVLCIMDAIPTRVIRTLEMLRAELIGGDVSVLPPSICLTSVNVIDLNLAKQKRDEVIFYGYDFGARESFSIYLIKDNGTKAILRNEVAFQSEYQFTIDLSGFSDAYLTTFRALAVSFDGNEMSRINIQKKDDVTPELRTVYITPSSFSFLPPHTRGDREFKGNGPQVRISTYLYKNSRQAYLRVYMKAEETKSDWTTAEGTSSRHYFYNAPTGWHIKKIDGQNSFPGVVEYLDTDTQDDIFNTTLGQFVVVGDTKGHEAGTRTGVSIKFSYRVPIVIEKD